ncbi:MAG: Holliday junction branch migration protein RuvA [Kiritimatiellae bacterium]|nr:Holliday junction branch migration protein RuvA [Kiritimatiellia bacterium]MCO5067876.1 Holliday junction branch migration protein RuvA [Kiritimatiellia bacterium]
MITFLEGVLVEKQPGRAVVNVGGVGYEVFIPLSSFERLPPEGAVCRVLTYHHVREDAQELFGFATEGERRLFQLLYSVSGVGPRTALGVLGGLSVRDIKKAIAEGDAKRLATVKGLGRKTSEKIIVELRDKLTEGEMMEAVASAEPGSAEELRTRDAILALISLGYKQADAMKMVKDVLPGVPANATVEDLVRRALA